jgi:hypothetical protein
MPVLHSLVLPAKSEEGDRGWRRRRADIEGAKEPDTPLRLLRNVAGRWVELALMICCIFSYILALLLQTHP